MELSSAAPSRWLDRLGVVASLGCGLHCAALSVVILVYPALWLNRELRASGLWEILWWTEIGLLVLAWVLATPASWLAWRRDRSPLVPALAILGLCVLTAAIASPLHGRSPWISVAALLGGLIVMTAHVLNLRHTRSHHRTVF